MCTPGPSSSMSLNRSSQSLVSSLTCTQTISPVPTSLPGPQLMFRWRLIFTHAGTFMFGTSLGNNVLSQVTEFSHWNRYPYGKLLKTPVELQPQPPPLPFLDIDTALFSFHMSQSKPASRLGALFIDPSF